MDKANFVFKMMTGALQDTVPNVQFCAVKCLHELKKYDTYHELWKQFHDPIKALENAADRDVCYYAMQALKPLSGKPIEWFFNLFIIYIIFQTP